MLLRQLANLGLGAALVFGSGGTLAASVEPQLISHGIAHDMLYGISMERRNGIAVGDFGLMFETADGGLTWSKQAKPATTLGLFGVVRKQGHCIAGGQNGLILTSADCKQWAVSAPVTKSRILSVAVNGSGTAYAVGGFGTLLKSADWGKTWQPVSIDWKPFTTDGAEPHLYDAHVAEDGEVTLVGEFELILRSKDGGASWQALHKGKRSLFGLTILDNGEAYAVGQEGAILKSSDRGASWNEQASGTQAILTGIWAQPDGSAFASGIYTILSSANGGKSWEMDGSKLAKKGWYLAVAGNGDKLQGKQNVVLVGSGGAILAVQR
jgi:photosystem II stability/assembly factor-like uncharacterized protein